MSEHVFTNACREILIFCIADADGGDETLRDSSDVGEHHMSKKTMMIGLGLALFWSSAQTQAQVPGLDTLGNMLTGGGADAAKTAAGAATNATDAATAATDAATKAVERVNTGKKALGHARKAVKHGKALKGKEAAGEAGDAAKNAADAVQ